MYKLLMSLSMTLLIGGFKQQVQQVLAYLAKVTKLNLILAHNLTVIF